MTSVFSFERRHRDQVAALWRQLHPDWTWLDDREKLDKVFGPSDAIERIGYVVQRSGLVIGSVFGTYSRDGNWPRNRFIDIESRPSDIAAEWLDNILASFIDADRGQPDTWHVATLDEILSPVVAPLLESAGFVRHASSMRMEWSGESVTVVDSSPVRFECYAGGKQDIDRAIVDLHNRSYRPAHVVPPANLQRLWEPWPGVEARGYVLAWDNDRLVGYGEWLVPDGKPLINSLVIARSHWGTSLSSAVGFRAIQVLLERGHRKIEATAMSNNAASIRLAQILGAKVVSEVEQTFVRRV